jgi:hypothetical protein
VWKILPFSRAREVLDEMRRGDLLVLWEKECMMTGLCSPQHAEFSFQVVSCDVV